MRYILNSAVITAEGNYSYSLITVKEMIEWLEDDFKSTVGYEETAEALEQLSGIKIDVNREMINMKTGDEALVFRLTRRMSKPEIKGKYGVNKILNNCEIGILKKVQ